ncbi:hypothetical protein ARTHRO9V_210323 [Arthrobacter sp. 9V]|nr:hypothetical protein ARTHRO9V_210323 [Arthrobacter sp. 9V]
MNFAGDRKLGTTLNLMLKRPSVDRQGKDTKFLGAMIKATP